MKPKLYAHPFSSYCQKVLIALYENDTAFELRMLGDEAASSELAVLWPLKRFPVLVDAGQTVMEASIIIEHLGLHHPGPVSLIPDDAKTALQVRLMDRFFDNYIQTPMQKVVADSMRAPEARDRQGVEEARAMLGLSYAWLERTMADRHWATGDAFTLADCAAAPALFYADWVLPISADLKHLRAYRARLLARHSMARAVEEARPYRSYFPLGAPDRD